MLPTIIWNVSITPIKAHYTVYKESVSDFLVRLCGIIGGIYAFATIFESLVRNGLCLAFPQGFFDGGSEANGPSSPPQKSASKTIPDGSSASI